MQLEEKKQYVKLLTSSMGVDLMKLEEKVKLTTFYRKYKNKEEINKALFEIIQNQKKTQAPIPKSLAETKMKVAKADTAKLVKAADLKMTRRESKIRKLVTTISKFQSEIVALQKEKDQALGLEEVNLSRHFVNITKAGFFSIAAHSGDIVLFDTVNDIICSDIDNKDLQVNLGKLVVRLDLQTMELLIFSATSKNITKKDLIDKYFLKSDKFLRYYDDYKEQQCHPYVARDGWICWGNAEGIIGKLKKSYDLEKLFQLLASLLITHSGGGFRHLSAWVPQKRKNAS